MKLDVSHSALFFIFLTTVFTASQGVDDQDSYDNYDDYEDEDYSYDNCDDTDDDGYCDYDDCIDADEDGYCDYESEGEQGEEPAFGQDSTFVKVDLGNTARLTCTVLNLGGRAISWKRGQSLLFLNTVPGSQDPRYSVEMTGTSSTLTVTLVRREDAGQLICQVASKPPIEQSFSIEIKAPPNVEIKNKPLSGEIVAEEGSRLELQCEGEGDPQPSLTWKRLNSQLPSSVLRPQSDSLVFPGLSSSDAGTYQCVADNGFGHPAMDSVTVLVKHKPIIYVQEKFHMNKETGELEVLALICSVQAFPRAETVWRRNDAQLPFARLVQSREGGRHVVTISRPRQSDVGVYTCEASNDMGQVFAVLSVPSNEDLPHIDTEEEEEEVAENKEELRSGSVTNSGGPIFLISLAIPVLLKIRE